MGTWTVTDSSKKRHRVAADYIAQPAANDVVSFIRRSEPGTGVVYVFTRPISVIKTEDKPELRRRRCLECKQLTDEDGRHVGDVACPKPVKAEVCLPADGVHPAQVRVMHCNSCDGHNCNPDDDGGEYAKYADGLRQGHYDKEAAMTPDEAFAEIEKLADGFGGAEGSRVKWLLSQVAPGSARVG